MLCARNLLHFERLSESGPTRNSFATNLPDSSGGVLNVDVEVEKDIKLFIIFEILNIIAYCQKISAVIQIFTLYLLMCLPVGFWTRHLLTNSVHFQLIVTCYSQDLMMSISTFYPCQWCWCHTRLQPSRQRTESSQSHLHVRNERYFMACPPALMLLKHAFPEVKRGSWGIPMITLHSIGKLFDTVYEMFICFWKIHSNGFVTSMVAFPNGLWSIHLVAWHTGRVWWLSCHQSVRTH